MVFLIDDWRDLSLDVLRNNCELVRVSTSECFQAFQSVELQLSRGLLEQVEEDFEVLVQVLKWDDWGVVLAL